MVYVRVSTSLRSTSLLVSSYCFFICFLSLQTTVEFSGIRIQIVGEEGKCTDHCASVWVLDVMSSNLGNDRLSSLNINLTIWVSNQKILFFDGKFISFEIKYIWHVCRYLIQVIRYPSHRRRRHENQSAFLLFQVLFRQKLKTKEKKEKFLF